MGTTKLQAASCAGACMNEKTGLYCCLHSYCVYADFWVKETAYSLSKKQLGTCNVLLEFGDYRMHLKEPLDMLFRPVIVFPLVFLSLVN